MTRRLLEEGLGRHDVGGIREVKEVLQSLKSRIEIEGQRFIEEVPGEGYRFISQPSVPGDSLDDLLRKG
jgi:DNA-binding winged helix-turn-helix (wHTH) protein